MNLLLINLISTLVHTPTVQVQYRDIRTLSVQTHAQKGHKAAPLPGADQPLTSK